MKMTRKKAGREGEKGKEREKRLFWSKLEVSKEKSLYSPGNGKTMLTRKTHTEPQESLTWSRLNASTSTEKFSNIEQSIYLLNCIKMM